MGLYIFLGIVFIFLLVLLVEFATAGNLNDFIDKKILRRFLWLWLPFYALWRLSREVIFKKKR